MGRITRRGFLKGLAAGGAAGAVGTLLPWGRRKALAGTGTRACATVVIVMRGGMDTVMHFDAKTGFANRDVQAADIVQTPAGVSWYQPTLGAMAAHMDDCTLIRNLSVSSSHPGGDGLLWYGERREEDAVAATPWANYMTAQLLVDRSAGVAAPNVVTYRTSQDDQIRNFVSFNNRSPDPLAAAQRVQVLQDFSNSLDVLGGQPPAPFQQRVFQTVDSLDTRLYNPVAQTITMENFEASNQLATQLLVQPPPIVWPPDAGTIGTFDLDAGDLDNTVGDNNQRLQTHLAGVFQLLKFGLTHVAFVQSTQGGYDTHNNHAATQLSRSQGYFPEIARFFDALKATADPVDGALTLYDTTNVVITTELSRANSVDNGEDTDGLGTPHWPWIQAACFGGAFKRGFTFGDLAADFTGVPADFNTGELGLGQNPSIKNLQATLMAACGVDPTGWTTDAPITAVLG